MKNVESLKLIVAVWMWYSLSHFHPLFINLDSTTMSCTYNIIYCDSIFPLSLRFPVASLPYRLMMSMRCRWPTVLAVQDAISLSMAQTLFDSALRKLCCFSFQWGINFFTANSAPKTRSSFLDALALSCCTDESWDLFVNDNISLILNAFSCHLGNLEVF